MSTFTSIPENSNVQYPSLLRRVQAMFIDFVVILCIFMVSSLIIGAIGSVPDEVKISILLFCFVLYEPLWISLAGGTIGHQLLKLRVKRYNTPERNIGLIPALGRIFAKTALGWISFLTVNSSSEKRAIHDILSGSVVLFK